MRFNLAGRMEDVDEEDESEFELSFYSNVIGYAVQVLLNFKKFSNSLVLTCS